MNRALFLSSLLCAGLVAACGEDDPMNNPKPDANTPIDTPGGGSVIRLNDDITTDTTFEAKNVYVIPRLKQLFVKNGATLTIEPGTVIQGEQGSVLVITRGSKIMAEGTKEKPIVLTSSQPAGQRTPGWWGGLLVLGSAPINTNKKPTPPATMGSDEATFEAFTGAIPEGKFGGNNAADNSGVIKYVRSEFAGFEYITGREFNNFTFAGVGSGTVIDFIQAHRGTDDGIELFGGTVNMKHIVSSQNEDDGFDTDNGWNGKVQFLIVQNITHTAIPSDDSNGYESDNHGSSASYEEAPRTSPTIYNATIIGDPAGTGLGNRKSFAAVFRRGTSGQYFNHLFIGFKQGPEFRDAQTKTQLDNGALAIKNSIFFNNDAPANNQLPPPQTITSSDGTKSPDPNDIVEANYLYADDGVKPARGNKLGVEPGIDAAFSSKDAPKFTLNAGAAALTGGAVPTDPFFDASATFIGAVGTVDWTEGWTTYVQN